MFYNLLFSQGYFKKTGCQSIPLTSATYTETSFSLHTHMRGLVGKESWTRAKSYVPITFYYSIESLIHKCDCTSKNLEKVEEKQPYEKQGQYEQTKQTNAFVLRDKRSGIEDFSAGERSDTIWIFGWLYIHCTMGVKVTLRFLTYPFVIIIFILEVKMPSDFLGRID